MKQIWPNTEEIWHLVKYFPMYAVLTIIGLQDTLFISIETFQL